MSENSNWCSSLQSFFDLRALALSGKHIDRKALCFVSGKDPRLWIDDAVYDDLILSIIKALRLKKEDDLLELGCAAGLLSVGLALKCRKYTGVDISTRALSVAKRLKLPNALFKHANAVELPFSECAFDCVLCYDVFNNFPSFAFGEKVINEGLRVLKPGGYICIGALPDIEKREADTTAWRQMQAEKNEVYGPQENFWPKENWRQRIFTSIIKWKHIKPQIICYYFKKQDFVNYGMAHGLHTEILPLHPLSPYRDTRFNVVYKKPSCR